MSNIFKPLTLPNGQVVMNGVYFEAKQNPDKSIEEIKEAISNFKGVQRRFELIWKNEQFVLIDDYAHHPAELKALLEGVRSLHGDTPCTIFFQPHLYTRTRDLAAEFGAALEAAEALVSLVLGLWPTAGASGAMGHPLE